MRPADSYRGARKNKQHGRKDEGNTAERDDRKSFVPHAFRIVDMGMHVLKAQVPKK